MFWRPKQQLHPVTLKLSVAALFSFFAAVPEPTAAAILGVVTDHANVSDVGVGYGGLSEADGLSLVLGAGAGESARATPVLFAWESQASPSVRSQLPLSLQSLLQSLSQLRLDGSGQQNGGTPQVPLLEQVGYANIYEGVYIFTPKTSPKTDSRAESDDNRNKSTTNTANNKASGPLSVVAPPQLIGLRLLSSPGSRAFQSGLLLYPNQELSSIPTNGTGKLNDSLKALSQFGALRIDDKLSLQPKTVNVNSLSLKAGYPSPSSLPGAGRGNTLGISSQIRQQLQEQAQKNFQQQQQEQVKLQQELQQQRQQEQQQQAERYREEQERFQQQQEELRERYEEQQQEIQERLREQLEEQQREIQQRL
jgi:hypothetical protein